MMIGKFIKPAIFIVIGGIVGFIYFTFLLVCRNTQRGITRFM
jgi:type II secretory pathway component PulF